MKRNLRTALASFIISCFIVSTSSAQMNGSNVYWHIDPGVKSCSMVIDPSLTQAQWQTFIKQAGAILTFKSLASAQPLGKANFYIALENDNSPIDQHSLAWINTFTHPDADCPLGDAVSFPAIRARIGLSEDMDLGAYWTMAPKANYGMVGGEVKYRLSQETEMLPTAAVRASVMVLTGVSDFDFSEYSVDLIASKKISVVTPYAGFRASRAIGTETTPKVNLDKESLFIAQGFAGVSCSVWVFNLAAEYNVSHINTFALAVGVGF